MEQTKAENFAGQDFYTRFEELLSPEVLEELKSIIDPVLSGDLVRSEVHKRMAKAIGIISWNNVDARSVLVDQLRAKDLIES